MALDDFSRFKKTPLTVVDGKETYGRCVPYSFIKTRPNNDLIGVHKVLPEEEGRPDRIAAALYGTPELDWVLLAFNRVIETLNWPRSGAVIEYPSETIVLPELL